MKFKRPRCDSCGVKLYPKHRPFRRYSYFFGDIPSFCPDCGSEISNQKRAQLDDYNTLLFGLWCIIFIIFFISVIIIIPSL